MKRLNALQASEAQRLGDVERDEAGRVWCRLFPRGEWHRYDFPDGILTLDDALFAAFVESWTDAGGPPLPIDYHHVEDAPAAGWVEALRVTEGGLDGAVRWTPRAAAHIKADEYRFLSPTWSMQHVSRRTGEKGGPWLYGAALLNDPYFNEMPRVAASASAETTQPQPTERRMDKKQICAALGLPEDTADEKVLEALAGLVKKAQDVTIEVEKEDPVEMKAAAEKADKLTAALAVATDNAAKLAARVEVLEAEKLKASAESFERDVVALLAQPKAGLPAMGETVRAHAKALGIESARKLVAALPDVPTAPVGTPGRPDADGDAVAAFDALVAEQMKAGLTYRDAARFAAITNPSVADKAFAFSK